LNDIKESISLAEKWLLNSGIQNLDKNSITYGSFNAWYDTLNKKFSFAYSEITGYGISALLFLNKIENKDIFVERAKLGVDWLMNKAFDDQGGVLCRYNLDENKFSDRICTFDNAMCLNALVNVYDLTKEEKYLEGAKKISSWLLKMQKDDGSFFTRLFKENGKLEENGSKWSEQSGCFHAKAAIGLLNLFKVTGDERYKEAARKICDYALGFQENDGRYVTDTKDKSTFVHAHCYTLEGLIAAFSIFKDKKYLDSLVMGINWIIKNQMPNGGFPAYFIDGKFVDVESPDISSQVIRSYLLIKEFAAVGNVDVELAIKRILKFQCMEDEKEIKGGFAVGKAWFHPEDRHDKHINSWVTMFVIQTMAMQINKLENIYDIV